MTWNCKPISAQTRAPHCGFCQFNGDLMRNGYGAWVILAAMGLPTNHRNREAPDVIVVFAGLINPISIAPMIGWGHGWNPMMLVVYETYGSFGFSMEVSTPYGWYGMRSCQLSRKLHEAMTRVNLQDWTRHINNFNMCILGISSKASACGISRSSLWRLPWWRILRQLGHQLDA